MGFKISEKDVKQILMEKVARMASDDIANLVMAYVVANKFKSTKTVEVVKRPGCILLMHKSGVSFAVTAAKDSFEVSRTDPESNQEKMEVSTANTALKMFPKFDDYLDRKVMPLHKSMSKRKWKSREQFKAALKKVEEKTRYFMMNMPELVELRRLMQIGNVI
jgi:hypothetical protein